MQCQRESRYFRLLNSTIAAIVLVFSAALPVSAKDGIEKRLDGQLRMSATTSKKPHELEWCLAMAADEVEAPRGAFRDGERTAIIAGSLARTVLVIMLTPKADQTLVEVFAKDSNLGADFQDRFEGCMQDSR